MRIRQTKQKKKKKEEEKEEEEEKRTACQTYNGFLIRHHKNELPIKTSPQDSMSRFSDKTE